MKKKSSVFKLRSNLVERARLLLTGLTSVFKAVTGTWILSATSTYSGQTAVTGGTLSPTGGGRSTSYQLNL
ncbi:MAG: autotransporter-associated beta strand repeat-containing protein [Verrucomicrobiota bacterium]